MQEPPPQGPPPQGPPGPPWAGPPSPGPPWTWPGGRRRGMRWRTSVSIILATGWLVFILLYAAFWAYQFTLFQNIVIFFASLVAVFGLMGALWAGWGMRMAENEWRHWR